MTPLPIDPLLPGIVTALRDAGALVVQAPPGAGKTTRVPRALLEAGLGTAGEIIVLQPRRLPARLAAARVAHELGEAPGGTVGYTVRFDDVSSAGTRLRFVTEGVLTRRLLAEPTLPGVAAVVLDEFHERHLATDLALALLHALRRGRRPDLRLCVMSATLDADPICEFLGGCPSVRSEGRAFDVAVEYLEERDVREPRYLADQVAAAVRRVCREGPDGDVLIFLPGASEIRRAAEALAPVAGTLDLLILPLHGDLPVAEQDRAVRPAGRRKVILSTNVAETSVTIDGVVVVIDSGLARIAGHSPWSRLPTLATAEVSRASAIQRAGRAGRTRPGRALRLFTRQNFDARRAFEVPEIQRLDLAETVLAIAAMGLGSAQDLDWFESPPPAALAAAADLLRQLGAIGPTGSLTDAGRAMLRFPLHPRLGRLLVEAERRGVGGQGAVLAALISERDVADRARVNFSRPGASGGPGGDGADLLQRLDLFEQARASGFARGQLRALELDGRAVEMVDKASRQLKRALRNGERPTLPPGDAADQALAIATLAAFPDRVLRRRSPGSSEAILATGGASSVQVGLTPPDELLVAVDVEERSAGIGRGASGVVVRAAVGIQPEWLIDTCPHAIAERDELVWNSAAERVDRVSRLSYGVLTLDESRSPAQPSAEAGRILLHAARGEGWGAPVAGDPAQSVSLRLAQLAAAFPDEPLPSAGGEAHAAALAALCADNVSFAGLRAAGVESLGLDALSPRAQALLRSEVPESWRLPGGRVVPIHYEADRPPWIESRLQDFFGMSAGPAICRGRVPLTLQLLAPNGRAVQVTRDLANFWRQHYPALRRELGRRYPRHPWPEDGATATPPPPKPPRPRS